MQTYQPHPISISGMKLPESLQPLVEVMAENVHDQWAESRIKEGWTYGVERSDKLKTNPCLVPYHLLPDNEKEYDRNTAISTILMIMKLGYSIEKSM